MFAITHSFPVHASRAGYALTHDVVKELASQGDAPGFFLTNVEDATVGVWVEYLTRVRWRDDLHCCLCSACL